MYFPGRGPSQSACSAICPISTLRLRQHLQKPMMRLDSICPALSQAGPAEALNETINTQPAMLAAGVAAWRCWQSAGGPGPIILSGHSLGEYTALVCANSLSFADGIKLVRKRAELMQSAVPAGEGAMAAILGLEDEQVVAACNEASTFGIAEPVNFNAPGQVVVAGRKEAVDKLVNIAKDAGARRAIVLPVSVPSHSTLMRPAGDGLMAALETTPFRTPEIAVIGAADVQPIPRRARYSHTTQQTNLQPCSLGGSNHEDACRRDRLNRRMWAR